MSFFYKLLEKFAQMLVPTGAILPFIGTEVPEGFILWQEYKIYESQLPKLYARYSTVENFTKGSDSSGNYVQLPSINDRTLQACSSFSLVGKLLEAALPNISGSLYASTFGDPKQNLFIWTEGAFSASLTGSTGIGSMTIDYDVAGKTLSYLTHNASQSSAIYSGSNLQPAALQTLIIIKV